MNDFESGAKARSTPPGGGVAPHGEALDDRILPDGERVCAIEHLRRATKNESRGLLGSQIHGEGGAKEPPDSPVGLIAGISCLGELKWN